jgi:hypothetical protein
MGPSSSLAALLGELEAISRSRPDRVLRLRGRLPVALGVALGVAPGREEPFELLIFRGFSSSVTHPTAFDPDCPALAEDAVIEAAELLLAPLDPARETRLRGPDPVRSFLDPSCWC